MPLKAKLSTLHHCVYNSVYFWHLVYLRCVDAIVKPERENTLTVWQGWTAEEDAGQGIVETETAGAVQQHAQGGLVGLRCSASSMHITPQTSTSAVAQSHHSLLCFSLLLEWLFCLAVQVSFFPLLSFGNTLRNLQSFRVPAAGIAQIKVEKDFHVKGEHCALCLKWKIPWIYT